MKTKKALVFVSNQDHMALEEAIIRWYEGYEIFFLMCDSSVRGCNVCRACDKATCLLCQYTMRKLIKPLLKQSNKYHLIYMSELINKEMVKVADNYDLLYNDIASLKKISFHGVEIGYGALSTYVTYTRNVMPNFNEKLKEYLNTLMRSEIKQTLALETFIAGLKPDLIIFHNGRFSNFKPIYCLTCNSKIDYVATEQWMMADGEVRKNNFFNEIPHSFRAINKKMLKAWDNAGANGRNVGSSFFYNRRNSKYAGDRIYTKNQVLGSLPEGFDNKKRNIAIFNSSEDEYCAVSSEYDKSLVYKNQYEALKSIFEHYKDDEGIHFYLRIHPNLKDVPWKSHTLLYGLKYPNVTIIPPTSSVSSYTLLDNSEKVIVFASTMGLEGSYWGKPVIALSRCEYTYMNLVYSPTSEEEVFNLIDNNDLKPLKNEINCCKVACYYMGFAVEPYKHYKVRTYRLKHDIEVNGLYKLLGSPVIYAYVRRILYKLSTIVGSGRKFRNLATRTM